VRCRRSIREGNGFGVHLGTTLQVTKPHIYSITNSNDRFDVRVTLPALGSGSHFVPYLLFGGGPVIAAFGYSPSESDPWADFEVGPDLAESMGKAWGIEVAKRVPLDSGLRYAWRVGAQPEPGKPIPIVLLVENHGSTAVRFVTGGRQRGPRNNRFAFVARLGGRGLPVKEADDHGGTMSDQRLAPGEHFEGGPPCLGRPGGARHLRRQLPVRGPGLP
jgi:hypothetical protein